MAKFDRNELYLGNFEGQKPAIAHLSFRQVYADTMLGELESGAIGLINKVTSGESILGGMQMVEKDAARATSYPRTGFAFLSFACENQPVSSAAVRKASLRAWIRTLARDYLKGYGMPVYGYYGYGQWMAIQSQAELRRSSISTHTISTRRARCLWRMVRVLNESGEAFDAASDAVRYKQVDGALVPLEISWAKTRDSEAASALQVMLENGFRAIGIGLSVTEMSYDEMSAYYYRQQDRSAYDMFFLATNFSLVFDPYPAMSAEARYQGVITRPGSRMPLSPRPRTHSTAPRRAMWTATRRSGWRSRGSGRRCFPWRRSIQTHMWISTPPN